MFLLYKCTGRDILYISYRSTGGAGGGNPTATGYARVVVGKYADAFVFGRVFGPGEQPNGVAHPRSRSTSGTITGSGSLTATHLGKMRRHLRCINVHSVNFPGGKIRGATVNKAIRGV